MLRIIDKDIESVTAWEEHDYAMLCRCLPAHESYWQTRIHAARKVRDALIEYRAAIDAPNKPTNLSLEP